MAAEDITCDLAIWPEQVNPTELVPGRLNEIYFRSLNIIYSTLVSLKEIC